MEMFCSVVPPFLTKREPPLSILTSVPSKSGRSMQSCMCAKNSCASCCWIDLLQCVAQEVCSSDGAIGACSAD